MIPWVGQQLELTGHDAQHLVDVIGRRADDDGQRAGVLVGGPLRPDRVGQPALFAHLLEEPARQAPPQHVIEHGQRPTSFVVTRDRPHAVDDVRLLGRPPHHVQSFRPGPGRRPLRRLSPCLAGEPPLEIGRDRVVGAVPRHRDHHVAGTVVMGEEVADVVCIQRADGRLRAQRVAPEGVPREQRGLPLLRHEVRRLVGVHQDLIEDDRAFGVDVGGTQGRIPHDVAEDVEPEREVLGQKPHVEGGVLLGGEGIAVPAHFVERLGDGRGRTRRRALEEKVLQEM